MCEAHAAATCFQAAFRYWQWRREVLWNPNTEVGLWYLLQTWKRWQKEDDAGTPDRLKPC
jgi:hypothetical protein